MLSHDEQRDVAEMLDLDMVENNVNVWGNQTTWDYDEAEMVTRGADRMHVWHCSLTLHPDEPALTDEQWARIAQDFMNEMEFTDTSGRSPLDGSRCDLGRTRAAGTTFISWLTSCVRTARGVNVWRGYNRAQRACSLPFEHKCGLAVVESREHQRGAIGETPAEQRRSRTRAGRPHDRQGHLGNANACSTHRNNAE